MAEPASLATSRVRAWSVMARGATVLAVGAGLLMGQFAHDPAMARGRGKRLALPAQAGKSVNPSASALQNLPPPEPFPDSASAKTELSIGDLHATVSPTDVGRVLPVGNSVAVTVAITGAGGNRTVAVLAEAEGGDILGITGAGARANKVRGGLAADIALNGSGNTNFVVEMGLKSGSKGPDGKPRNRLRLTLLPQKGGRDESVLAWGLADCAGNYYSELQKILGARRERMMSQIDLASTAEPELPAKWLFPAQSVSPLLICKGKKANLIAACASAMTAKSADSKTPPATWDEGRILQLAASVASMKGALPGFQKRIQPLRQASYTMLSQLRGYLEQNQHPALCSGVGNMIDYFYDRTTHVRTAISDAKEALPAAQALAKAKVAEFAGTSAAAAGSGVISAANAAEASVSPYAANELIDRIGKAVLSATDASETAAIPDTIPKLEHLRALLDSPSTADLPADRHAAAISALRLIEANLYLAVAAKKFASLDDAIYGTMSAIRDAHKSTCVCEQ